MALGADYTKAFLALGAWYVVNVATVILNKYIFQMYEFGYPLTLTITHFFCCCVGSILVLRVFKQIPIIPVSSQDVTRKLLPFAVLFCANIVLGNISLRWVPVSFMQTIKAAVPACTTALQVIFMNVRFDKRIYVSLIPVVGGVMLASYTEVNFDWRGFLAAVAACFTTAAQTVLSGFIMQYKFDSVNLIYYMAPLSLAILGPFAGLAEGPEIMQRTDLQTNIKPLLMILVISGAIAFLLNWTTFLAIQSTSSLTFNVAGNLKSVIAIVISVLVFKNEIGPLNALGCIVALAGVGWYGVIKHEISEKEKAARAAEKVTVAIAEKSASAIPASIEDKIDLIKSPRADRSKA
mmetsp:Transcript_10480/g.17132  ORF Transcript_10480/g.17132 Transcript_10480/m.17132 type:complete len:350 (-) Transcript_10480:446-1495(-)|eukprot:CAMPEP_0184663012 /NCGR_PEP_ID=MMETSP0308-20130426/46059_1 /TAXON_ID=38269 /ORGANISM="Gloeochaete witrockiana, Strain SAG 46.84" /LENGTH=349 /DNA_ID=CAMNT_0027105441 /DNA_START=166 /DNA_END=1215 /DNA_ORIENTATION=+